MLREMGREMLLTCSACSRCPRSKHSPLLSSGVSPRDRLVLQFGRGKEGNACRCVHALPASPSHACLRPEGPESAGATPSNATVVAAPTALAFGIVHRVNRELRRQCVVCRALRLQCTGCTWRPPNDSTSPTGTKGDPHRNRCTRHNTWTQLPGGGGGGGGGLAVVRRPFVVDGSAPAVGQRKLLPSLRSLSPRRDQAIINPLRAGDTS